MYYAFYNLYCQKCYRVFKRNFISTHKDTHFLVAVYGWEREMRERKKKVQTVHNSIVGQVKKNSKERTNYSIVNNVYGCHAIEMFWIRCKWTFHFKNCASRLHFCLCFLKVEKKIFYSRKKYFSFCLLGGLFEWNCIWKRNAGF